MSNQKSTHRRKFTKHIVWISLVFALGTASTLGLAWQTGQAAKNARVAINVAGRQRMLNQQHAKEVLSNAYDPKQDFASTRELLVESANKLIEGGATDFGELPATKDPELLDALRRQLTSLDCTFAMGDALLRSPQDNSTRDVFLNTTNEAHQAVQTCVEKIQEISVANTQWLFIWQVLVSIGTAVACLAILFTTSRGFISGVQSSATSLRELASVDLKAVANDLQNNADITNHQATLASGAADQVSSNAKQLSSAVSEFNVSITEISSNTSEAASVASQAVAAADETNASVTKLGQSSDEIGNVIKVINSIAEQTNLLALNATIEAARAGEAGKGFAVVANEVKELAKQTSAATEDIISKIATIQHDTTQAVGAITRVSEVISTINKSQNAIASAVEQQSAMTSEISRNIEEVSTGSMEIARSISVVAEAANSTSRAAEQSLAKVGAIESGADALMAW